MNGLEYPIVIAPLSVDDGGGFVAVVPDLKGCMSDGETREEAVANVQDAIQEWIEEAIEAGIEVPAPYSSAKRAIAAFSEAVKKLEHVFEQQDILIEQLENDLSDLAALFEEQLVCSVPVRMPLAVAADWQKRIGAH